MTLPVSPSSTQPTGNSPLAGNAIPSGLVVALLGNPNTGKSTLFNGLTGLSARVGNFPGVTVEKKVGQATWNGRTVQLLDLPGTYGLTGYSPDELVTVDVLLGRRSDTPRPDVLICVLDAANLERNLYLFSQASELGLPLVAVLNMSDQLERAGKVVDCNKLEELLGAPVVLTEAHRGIGLDQIPAAVERAMRTSGASSSASPERNATSGSARAQFPAPFLEEINALASEVFSPGEVPKQYLLTRAVLDVGGELETGLGPKVQAGVLAARQRLAAAGFRLQTLEAKARYGWAQGVLAQAQQQKSRTTANSRADKIDAVLTHPWWGTITLVACLILVLQLLGTCAAPMQAVIEAGIGLLSARIESLLPPGMLRSMLTDGILAGAAGVLVFVPQIALLFALIALLEDCGYMARAAFLVDRAMTWVGLSGKSFLPLMSSFACAVPGIMAARVIENPKDRLLTILVAPLMSCSARLPVYLLLTYNFVPDLSWGGGWIKLRALVLAGLYCIGPLVAFPVAWLVRRFLLPGQAPPFVMELPSFKWPSLRVVLARVWESVTAFVARASTMILATSLVVWAAAYFPADHRAEHALENRLEALTAENDPERDALEGQLRQLQAKSLQQSYLSQAGHWLEPVVKPLGWDWRIGMGVLASFPAREVIIATLGTIYSLGADVEEDTQPLAQALQASVWPDGRPVFTLPVALSLMVFFALCAQCVSTLSIMRRETNSVSWPVFTFVYMTGLAYVGAWLTFQLASYWLG